MTDCPTCGTRTYHDAYTLYSIDRIVKWKAQCQNDGEFQRVADLAIAEMRAELGPDYTVNPDTERLSALRAAVLTIASELELFPVGGNLWTPLSLICNRLRALAQEDV